MCRRDVVHPNVRGVQLDFTRPGKPTDNGHIESFNGRLRDKCLNVQQFLSLDDATQSSKLGGGTTMTTPAQLSGAPDPPRVYRYSSGRTRRRSDGYSSLDLSPNGTNIDAGDTTGATPRSFNTVLS